VNTLGTIFAALAARVTFAAARTLLLVAVLVPLLIPSPALAHHLPAASDPAAAAPMVTVTLSRTEISAADRSVGGERGTCVRDDKDIAPLDTQVLPWMAANTPRVHLTGSVETGATLDASEWCAHGGETRAASWAQMQQFQSQYGMHFISHSATYPLVWSMLTPKRQYAETCGSRNAITAHGLVGADGQFDWPDNKLDPTVQSIYVEPCFYFNRIYQGTGINTAAWATANLYEVSTKQIQGGACNVAGLPCSTALAYRYTVPRQVITQIQNLQPGQHYSLQTYLLVRNTNPAYQTNKARWDCTGANPAYHWSNDVERYCWSDFKRILTFLQNDPNIVLTDPEGVAVAWGMSPPAM
jgi:hypothetical protein